jgi:hypothetical protein
MTSNDEAGLPPRREVGFAVRDGALARAFGDHGRDWSDHQIDH